MRDTTREYVCHDSFICVTWLIIPNAFIWIDRAHCFLKVSYFKSTLRVSQAEYVLSECIDCKEHKEYILLRMKNTFYTLTENSHARAAGSIPHPHRRIRTDNQKNNYIYIHTPFIYVCETYPHPHRCIRTANTHIHIYWYVYTYIYIDIRLIHMWRDIVL